MNQPVPQQMQVPVPVSQDELYATMIQEEKVRNIISQISPQNYLEEVRWLIKGYYKDTRTGTWKKIDPNGIEPNELLVGRYVAYLGSIINQNTSLANLSSNQINKLMGMAVEYLVDDINANAELYGLHNNYTERTRICNIMLNSFFMVLNRALDGMEAKRMWNALNIGESSNPFQQQQKQGKWWQFWK